jgi:hypothetical protein
VAALATKELEANSITATFFPKLRDVAFIIYSPVLFSHFISKCSFVTALCLL